MPDDNVIWSCEFEFVGHKIPQEIFEKFTEATAKLTGTKGYIQKAKDGLYTGKLEGRKEVIEKFQQLVSKAEQFKGVVEKAVFKNMKKIKEYTEATFEVKSSK